MPEFVVIDRGSYCGSAGSIDSAKESFRHRPGAVIMTREEWRAICSRAGDWSDLAEPWEDPVSLACASRHRIIKNTQHSI